MAGRLSRGDVRLRRFAPPDKQRRVAVLTPDGAIGHLSTITVVPVAFAIRGVPSEVVLDVQDGMKGPCAVNLHNAVTVAQARLGRRVGVLGAVEYQPRRTHPAPSACPPGAAVSAYPVEGSPAMLNPTRDATLLAENPRRAGNPAGAGGIASMIKPILFAVFASGALLVSVALSQDAEYKGLTARELCLRPPVHKTVVKPAVPVKPKVEIPDQRPRPAEPEESSGVGTAGQATLVNVSMESEVPLGLRYSLLKRAEGEWEEVDADSTFHAGDRIRLKIMTYDDGYLYVVQRGSSDHWEVLFPNEAAGDTSNRLSRKQTVTKQFYFDQTPGEERLFLVYTRQPQRDLEALIHKLSAQGASAPALQPVPAQMPKVAPKPDDRRPPKVLMAENRPPMDDSFVARLRASLQSRDLVFEKVDDDKGETREKAVYVAVPSRGPDASVVADLTLKHR